MTVVARVEAASAVGGRRWLSLALPLVILVPATVVRPSEWTWPALAAIVCVSWLLLGARHALAAPPRIKAAVLGWLSGICLIDGFYLTLLDRPLPALVALGCFALTVFGHGHIAGT